MNTHILENVSVPAFSENNRVHLKLAELSEAAHRAVASGEPAELARIEREIDRSAAKLWDLVEDEMDEIRASLIDRQTIGYEWNQTRETMKEAKVSLADELVIERDKNRA